MWWKQMLTCIIYIRQTFEESRNKKRKKLYMKINCVEKSYKMKRDVIYGAIISHKWYDFI